MPRSVSRDYNFVVSQSISVNGYLNPGTQGSSYTSQLTANGGTKPFIWSIPSIPCGGLSLNTSTGIISGIPVSAGSWTITITVTDANGATDTKTAELSIASNLRILTPALPDGTAGKAYSFTLTGTGGSIPYTWGITNLPPGFNLNFNTGVISGTTNAVGQDIKCIVSLTDSKSKNVTKTLELTIKAAPVSDLVIATDRLPDGKVNVGYSAAVTAGGGIPPYSWTYGTFPSGISGSANGVISGVPIQAASGTVAVTVRDNPGSTASKALPISISPADPVDPGNPGNQCVNIPNRINKPKTLNWAELNGTSGSPGQIRTNKIYPTDQEDAKGPACTPKTIGLNITYMQAPGAHPPDNFDDTWGLPADGYLKIYWEQVFFRNSYSGCTTSFYVVINGVRTRMYYIQFQTNYTPVHSMTFDITIT